MHDFMPIMSNATSRQGPVDATTRLERRLKCVLSFSASCSYRDKSFAPGDCRACRILLKLGSGGDVRFVWYRSPLIHCSCRRTSKCNNCDSGTDAGSLPGAIYGAGGGARRQSPLLRLAMSSALGKSAG